MSLIITYFVHGTTTDNERGLATGWLPGELSALGIRQSKELGQIIKTKKFSAIYCSDLKRAVDSAQLAFGNRFKIITDRRLREINYGGFNGQEENFKNDLDNYITRPFPNGESYRDVEKRIRDFLTEIKINNFTSPIAIMSHQAPQLALEVMAKGKTWAQAIQEDWRRTKSWQPGWEYHFK